MQKAAEFVFVWTCLVGLCLALWGVLFGFVGDTAQAIGWGLVAVTLWSAAVEVVR
jgi:hypothetical protein